MGKRITYHVLFWLTYLLWSGYVSGSYDDNFYRSFITDLIHLPLKISVTYFLMYYMLPQYMLRKNYARLFLISIILLVVSSLIYRLTIYKLTWPYFYPDSSFYFWNLPKFLTGAFDIFSIAAIAVSIKLFRTRFESQQREEKLRSEKAETELRFLKTQMNPHFLFNTLNSIYALTRAQSPSAPDAVMRLSKILRYILYETQKKTSSLEEELKIVDDYIQLQQLRFGSKIQFIDKRELDNPSMHIAHLLLLPLVENAFKHGVGNTMDKVEIYFYIKLNDGLLHLQIKNPAEEDSKEKSPNEGIGLANISRQLQLLYSEYTFNFGVKESDFIVDLRIQIKSYIGHELPDSGR